MTRIRNANRLNGEGAVLCHNKVVLAVAKANAQGQGALLSADATVIKSSGDVVNTGGGGVSVEAP